MVTLVISTMILHSPALTGNHENLFSCLTGLLTLLNQDDDIVALQV